MTIEVSALIDRDSPIFLAGETINITVTLKNLDNEKGGSLAWGCVQLHCDQTLPASVVEEKKAPSQVPEDGSKTAVSRAKQAIYSSAPAIIFCDISFKPLEEQQFEVAKYIPLLMPPSFKGHYVKYTWYVSVAVQHVDSPIKMLQLPIKVINVTVDTSPSNEDGDSFTTTNPFVLRERQKPSVIDLVAGRVEEVTSVRTQRSFAMRNGDDVFAVITMFKNLFKMGDDVIGKIEFHHERVNCLQVLVRIETVEVNLLGDNREEHVCPQSSEHFITAFVKETHFKLSIPLTVTPSFTTEAVQLRWRVHFEFVTSTNSPLKTSDGGLIARAAQDLVCATMSWDHYISTLHCCNPFNIMLNAQRNLLSNTSSLIV